jgi:hypothetical protein
MEIFPRRFQRPSPLGYLEVMFDDPSSEALPTAQALARAQLALLGELAQIGLELARDLRADVGGQVRSTARERAALETDDALIPLQPPPAFPGDVCLAYARLSRAVRLTLALQTRILRGLEQRESAQAAIVRPRPAAGGDGERPSRERLTDPDDLAALAELPFEAAVDFVRRELGLPADWPAGAPRLKASERLVEKLTGQGAPAIGSSGASIAAAAEPVASLYRPSG